MSRQAVAETADIFRSERLERVFARCFASSFNTVLVGGADEPLYQPAISPGEPHRLYYREDFFASALHEISHWCIAGGPRLAQVDFGYWYAAEGRNEAQQKAFEAVEAGPQGLEWVLSRACGWHFQLSADNFGPEGVIPDTGEFALGVLRCARQWCERGLPGRAQTMYAALCKEFGTDLYWADLKFQLADIRR